MAASELNTNSGNNGAVKIAGYLEKKSKKRVVSIWKKYWFVLEGRLLLYYKSEAEVTNLYPCRGSINMGLANGVRPLLCRSTQGLNSGTFVFEIVTHTNNTVLLRTKDRNSQELWLQALLDALGGSTTLFSSSSSPINLNHFRYSMDNLVPVTTKSKLGFKRQNTLPSSPQSGICLNNNNIRAKFRSAYMGGSNDCIYSKSLESLLQNREQNKNLIKDKMAECDHSNSELYQAMRESDDSPSSSQVKLENRNIDNSVQSKANETFIVNKDISEEPKITEEKGEQNEKPENEENFNDDIEYYCSYGDIQTNSELNLEKYEELTTNAEYSEYNEPTNEPTLPPRHEPYENKYEVLSQTSNIEQKSKCKSILRRSFNFLNRDKTKVKTKGVKRRMSFLQKFLKHKKKSDTSSMPPDQKMDEEKEEDCIYEYVDVEKLQVNSTDKESSDKSSSDKNSRPSSPEVERKKIVGTTEMLNPQTMLELKDKLRKKIQPISTEDEEVEVLVHAPPPVTEEQLPGLPPRKGSRSRPRSPWHDIPSNNTPFSKPHSHRAEIIVSPHQYNSLNETYTVFSPGFSDSAKQPVYHPSHVQKQLFPFTSPEMIQSPELLDDSTSNSSINVSQLYSKIEKKNKHIFNSPPTTIDSALRNIAESTPEQSELSVRELINKFNHCDGCLTLGSISLCKNQIAQRRLNADNKDIVLRKEKCESCQSFDQKREKTLSGTKEGDVPESKEIDDLLNELTKITSAPLMQPGITSSLTQMPPKNKMAGTKSAGPMTDEEWLAIAPIRRRRHSEPDYDVPRSHRTINIIPPIPPKNILTNEQPIVPSTRFFGSTLPTSIISDSIEPPSLPWTASNASSTSITPDSLENFDNYAKINNTVRTLTTPSDELDRSMGNETIHPSPQTLLTIEEKSLEDENIIRNKLNNNDQVLSMYVHELETDNSNDVNKNMQLISGRFFDSLEQSTIF